MIKKPSPTTRKTTRATKLPTSLHQCSECNFNCISINSLNIHVSAKHGDKNSFKCTHPDCKFRASSRYFLVKHAIAEHGFKKPAPIQRKKLGKKASYAEFLDDELSKEVEVIESLLEEEEEEEDDDSEVDKDWGEILYLNVLVFRIIPHRSLYVPF